MNVASANQPTYADSLAANPVNHFQLLVNNLNMLFIIKIDDFTKNNQEHGLKTIFVKVSATKDNKLIFNLYYEASVNAVSRAKCKDQLEKDMNEMFGDESKVVKLLQVLSFYEMSQNQAELIIRDAYINLFISAAENKELSVSCSK